MQNRVSQYYFWITKTFFLSLFCLLSVEVEAFKHMWGNTARFMCFLKKLFFVFEKLFVSMAWNFGNTFGQLNKWYRPYRPYNLMKSALFILWKKKNLAWNLFSFELDILISWYLTRSHDISIRIRILSSRGPLNRDNKMART